MSSATPDKAGPLRQIHIMVPSKSTLYLIPAFLDEHSLKPLPAYLLDAVKECQVFFVENERSARRYLKSLWREMVIDDYEWFTIHKAEEQIKTIFRQKLKEGRNIGIISEAGCPGIADPGQALTEVAHQAGATVRPLVGPSSILLALMASGMNGQQFRFAGYIPVDHSSRAKALKDLEQDSLQKNCTQVFIETPYRNNPLLETILQTCRPTTQLCIAADLTSPEEYIRTKTIAEWKQDAATDGGSGNSGNKAAQGGGKDGNHPKNRGHLPDLHKRPAIFCLLAK